MTGPATEVVLVVDCANVVGARPDGWWRDRAGANQRLLGRLATLPGVLPGPDGEPLRLAGIIAVVEGRARDVPAPVRLTVVRADADGDTAVVGAARDVEAAGGRPLVVSADRGLRARLTAGARVAGPAWLLACLEAAGA